MPNVAFVRNEVKNLLEHYEITSDCCDGDITVKNKKSKYLPKPNSTDVSRENVARYEAYLTRAIFYNVVHATYNGFIGQIFARASQIKLPPVVSYLETNCDGTGKGIEQLAKEKTGIVLKLARSGILIEYPKTTGPKTKEEIETENLRPTLKLFKSTQIVNWRKKEIGSEIVFNMIVLKDSEIYSDDGFEFKERDIYKVLRLSDENVYSYEIWRGSNKLLFALSEEYFPTNVDGKYLDRIPFEFCGSDNNDEIPDIPVLYDMSVLNIGHYRNSADYEESCYIVGQPTPWFSGLSEEWVKNNPTIQLGSRAAIPLPTGGDAGLLQASPNIMPMEAMKHKEEQMLALGAKLVTPSGVAKTATESSMDNATETSVLSSIANNVSKCIENSIRKCLQFVRTTGNEEIIFKLNTDFEISKMSTAERNQLLNEWMKNAISFTEYRSNLRNGKIAILDDEKAKKEMEEEAANALDLEVTSVKALAEANPVASVVGKS